VIEVLRTPITIKPATDKTSRPARGQNTTRLEHMFDIKAKCRYIRPYER